MQVTLAEKLAKLDEIYAQNLAIIIGLELVAYNLTGERVDLREMAQDPELLAQLTYDMNQLRAPKSFDEAISLEPSAEELLNSQNAEETDEKVVAAAYAAAGKAWNKGEKTVESTGLGDGVGGFSSKREKIPVDPIFSDGRVAKKRS